MRLWSIHPKYMDCAGLLAVWREGLLAKKVLQNKTKGYKNHPQLLRFKKTKNPVSAINQYLFCIWEESKKRCYNFDKSKIQKNSDTVKINVAKGQINYEFDHLKKKLKSRSKNEAKYLEDITEIEPHPIFNIIEGKIELWEKVR